jgi:hypothetical protein
MLVNKPYEENQIVSFKLVNGDEVVAKVVEEQAEAFIVSKPCTVMPSQQGIGLLQSLFTSSLDSNVTLDKKHIMLHAPTIKDIENHYVKTTTGIEPVNAGAIVT